MKKIELRNFHGRDGFFEAEVWLNDQPSGNIVIENEEIVGGSYFFEEMTKDEENHLIEMMKNHPRD